jgi:hypothetical protein
MDARDPEGVLNAGSHATVEPAGQGLQFRPQQLVPKRAGSPGRCNSAGCNGGKRENPDENFHAKPQVYLPPITGSPTGSRTGGHNRAPHFDMIAP